MALRDADIREPLFDFLEEMYGKVRIIEEKNAGRSRADVVMVTEDVLFGLEIKSDADSFARLKRQVKDYDKYFDYNYAVVGSTHGLHIREHVPDYWGVITVEEVDGKLDFYILRRPLPNPKKKPERKLSFLWRPELFKLQMLHNMPKYKDKSKDFVIKKLVERTQLCEQEAGYIDSHLLDREISEILFERDYTQVTQVLAEYRKGELQKQIETESDPRKRFELMLKQEMKGKQLKKKRTRKRR